jgi:membrane-associated PAP2 superfamily phosphatase
MHIKLERRWQELIVLLALMALTTPLFWFSKLDLELAGIFYVPGDSHNLWPWKQGWHRDYLFDYGTKFTLAMLGLAALALISGYLKPDLKHWQRPALYIILVIALGPGLIVNLVFKDHWGRPRPVHMHEFGGTQDYLPPLAIGPGKEKSFPCGHCSIGYMFFALYFLSRKRKVFYFCLTLVFAGAMALTRMTAGGHFVSDILWSGYVVFAVAWLLYYGWYERR